MNLTDSRLAQGGSEKLDLAILSFFEQFRKIYVGDQVQKTSKVSIFLYCPYFVGLVCCPGESLQQPVTPQVYAVCWGKEV